MSISSVVPEVQHAQVNGVRIAYQDTGKGEPLVLVHGSWGSHRNWDPVVPGLSAHHRVVSYDRRGHSESERPTGQGTFAEDVADLAVLIEALDAAPAWVIGNSVGAVITLRLAAARPDLLRGVIVHEPPLRRQLSEGGADGPLRMVLDLIRAGDHAGAAERFVEDVALGPGAWAQLPGQMRATMADNAPTYLDEELAPDSQDRRRGRPRAVRRPGPGHLRDPESPGLPAGDPAPRAAAATGSAHRVRRRRAHPARDPSEGVRNHRRGVHRGKRVARRSVNLRGRDPA